MVAAFLASFLSLAATCIFIRFLASFTYKLGLPNIFSIALL
jgi:hypothetical protein